MATRRHLRKRRKRGSINGKHRYHNCNRSGMWMLFLRAKKNMTASRFAPTPMFKSVAELMVASGRNLA